VYTARALGSTTLLACEQCTVAVLGEDGWGCGDDTRRPGSMGTLAPGEIVIPKVSFSL
jgi:hypothetical protein